MVIIFICILTIVILILQYLQVDSKKKKSKVISQIILFTGVLIAISQGYTSYIAESNSNEKTIRIDSLQTELLKYSSGAGASPTILIEGHEYNTEMTKDFKIFFKILNRGKYPLRNISIQFKDSYSRQNKVRRDYGPYDPGLVEKVKIYGDLEQDIFISAVPPESERRFYTGFAKSEFLVNNVFPVKYDIDVFWDNGYYEIEVFLKYFKKTKRVGIKEISVYDVNKAEYLDNHIIYDSIFYRLQPDSVSVLELLD